MLRHYGNNYFSCVTLLLQWFRLCHGGVKFYQKFLLCLKSIGDKTISPMLHIISTIKHIALPLTHTNKFFWIAKTTRCRYENILATLWFYLIHLGYILVQVDSSWFKMVTLQRYYMIWSHFFVNMITICNVFVIILQIVMFHLAFIYFLPFFISQYITIHHIATQYITLLHIATYYTHIISTLLPSLLIYAHTYTFYNTLISHYLHINLIWFYLIKL